MQHKLCQWVGKYGKLAASAFAGAVLFEKQRLLQADRPIFLLLIPKSAAPQWNCAF
jgi:hypothetical protein